MNNELEQFRQEIADKSDDELVRMFDDADAEYPPEKIDVIMDEVERRNIQLEPDDSDFEENPKEEKPVKEVSEAETNRSDKRLFVFLAFVSGLVLNFLMLSRFKMTREQQFGNSSNQQLSVVIGEAIGVTIVWLVISGAIAGIYKLITRKNQWQYVFIIAFAIVAMLFVLGDILRLMKK